MKKPSVSLKNSWPNNTELEISKQRRWIEFLVEKKKKNDSKFSTKLIKLLKKIF